MGCPSSLRPLHKSPNKNQFDLYLVVLFPFKTSGVPLPPKTPENTRGNQIPNLPNSDIAATMTPTRKKIHYPTWHNPKNVKHAENETPNLPGCQAMQKEMSN
jgi:hypothetical protein